MQKTTFPKFAITSDVWQLAAIWLALRLFTGLWVALLSVSYPQVDLEREVALWPPSQPYSVWADRALLSPWHRRDANIFRRIIVGGYQSDPGATAFHPLYPWLGKLLMPITHNPVLALFLVSSAASLGFLIAFEYLAKFDLAPPVARKASLLMLLSPSAYILFAPYTESLFLFLAVLSFIGMRKQRWWLAGLTGGLAVLTRAQGILLLFPLAWELWDASGRNLKRTLGWWRAWLPLGLIPLALLSWIVYRIVVLNDAQVDFSSVHTLIYSTIISPNAEKVVPGQKFLWPWRALWLAIQRFLVDFEPRIGVDLSLATLFLVAFGLAWPRMRSSYRIYVAAIAIISFAYHTGWRMPYMGLPRHLFLAFPIFIGLVPVLKQRYLYLFIIAMSFMYFLFLLLLYVNRGWIP